MITGKTKIKTSTTQQMENKLTFFGIYENSLKFRELSEQEQKKFLIKHNIYIKGKSDKEYDKDLVNHFYVNRSQNILFLGKDFMLSDINYTINSEFIDEVYKAILEGFENGNFKNINDHVQVLKLSYDMIEDEEEKAIFLNDKKKLAKQDYQKELINKIFQDFHNQKKNDINYKENVIKKHLIYDIKHLSDYIFGLNNISSFLTISAYFSFLRTTEILKFCDEHNSELEQKETASKSKGLDGTQKVLLIEKLIKLAHKWESTDERKKAFIISKIIDRSEDNIRKTLAKSSKKPSLYSEKFINDIALADEIINKLG